MCYVQAFVGYKNKSVDLMKMIMLSVGNNSRGNQSTGLYSPVNGIIKDNVGFEQFFLKNKEIVSDNLMIMHGRMPTTGFREAQDAHPFYKEYNNKKIIFVHNGVISNANTVSKTYNIEDPRVDSEIIGETILRKGIQQLKELQGNMNILWVDPTNPYRLMVQRRNNPLFVGITEEGLYFSSLENPLKTIGATDITSLDEHKVFTYEDGKLLSTEEIEKPTPIYPTYNYNYNKSSYDDLWDEGEYDWTRSNYKGKKYSTSSSVSEKEDLSKSEEILSIYLAASLNEIQKKLFTNVEFLFKYCNITINQLEKMSKECKTEAEENDYLLNIIKINSKIYHVLKDCVFNKGSVEQFDEFLPISTHVLYDDFNFDLNDLFFISSLGDKKDMIKAIEFKTGKDIEVLEGIESGKFTVTKNNKNEIVVL